MVVSGKRIRLPRVTRIFQVSLSSKFALEGSHAVAAVSHGIGTQKLQAKATLHALRTPQIAVSCYLQWPYVLLIYRNLQGRRAGQRVLLSRIVETLIEQRAAQTYTQRSRSHIFVDG